MHMNRRPTALETRAVAALCEPLQGKTSLSKVVWGYGLLGSIVVGAVGLFIDSDNRFAMHAYTLFGLAFSVYVTIATYRCAGNCQSRLLAQFVRISALVSLLALPVLAYLEFTGALDLSAITPSGVE